MSEKVFGGLSKISALFTFRKTQNFPLLNLQYKLTFYNVQNTSFVDYDLNYNKNVQYNLTLRVRISAIVYDELEITFAEIILCM